MCNSKRQSQGKSAHGDVHGKWIELVNVEMSIFRTVSTVRYYSKISDNFFKFHIYV